MTDVDWEARLAGTWAELDTRGEAEFRALITDLTEELPADDPRSPFERAAALDSTGHSDLAVPLYRDALAAGLVGERRRRALIQLASSLRNTGDPAAGVALLEPELSAPSDHLDGAVRGFLALCLADVGREREAVAVALGALAPLLPRYQRSLANYARALV
ncbi:tetratricopeptide repeat protein [Actinokineospora spheciospongiae]|uniref:tetratricopeptide repeat protein n=1 Tax=Actinokineospora spheciospongiae TaxID=909613 RepID=UPI000557CDB0|nr:tetratricopeptide repeat protein [Actinokineospora spheciospongiae]PWW54893.1 tetratricopeptide repeat protein [Actinokineospora spheciospongiae]